MRDQKKTVHIDKQKLRRLALEYEAALDEAQGNGVGEIEDFRAYLHDEVEKARNLMISEPIEINTQGVWRYSFSETPLGNCDRVISAFVRFVNCLDGTDQDPEYLESIEKTRKLQQAVWRGKKD